MSETKPRMDWEELSQTPEFQLLTDKQKMFVATYISNGYDVLHAMRTAYDCKNNYLARIRSYPVLRSPVVGMVLMLHLGRPFEFAEVISTQEGFIKQLAKDISKGAIKWNKLQAMRFYAEVNGWYKSQAVQAAEIARDMGYGPAQSQTGIDNNIKKKLISAVEKRPVGGAAHKPGSPKRKKTDEEQHFDLSHYENLDRGE